MFKVNEYISLSLRGDKTIIYIKGKKFRQCKSILLDISQENVRDFDDIHSIDEASESLKRLDRSSDTTKNSITPKEEFWGHCSNLQAWVEHDYDTRLIHRSLAFPLLKKLTDVGEAKASIIFKLEILKRLFEGGQKTREYLVFNRYIDYLTEDELRSMIFIDDVLVLETIERKIGKHFTFARYLEDITGIGDPSNVYYIGKDLRITGLRIFNNGKIIPEDIVRLKSLKYLVLSYNSFELFPPSLSGLQYLKHLDLRRNYFKTIPESLKNLTRLKLLDLASNQLSQIPPFLSELSSLEELYLDENLIPIFPEAIGKLKRNLDDYGYFKVS